MTDAVGSSSPESVSGADPVTEAAASKDATKAGMAASASGFSGTTKVSSFAQLRQKAPEVWKKTLESIAQQITRQMHRSEERRKRNSKNS